MRVQEVMAKEICTCRAEEPLSVAARIMWDRDLGAVPVAGADGNLVGIITDRDVCMAAYFAGAPLASIPVGEHMSTQVFTARPEQGLESAEELMRSNQIRRLPVVDESGRLVGMVTLGDIARAAAARGRRAVDADQVVSTLAAISQPRAALTAAA